MVKVQQQKGPSCVLGHHDGDDADVDFVSGDGDGKQAAEFSA